MHSMGDPQTMQDDPRYDDVVLDVYDYLAARVQVCLDAGLSRGQIIVDVGVGFGKTLAHNLALLRGMAVFHGLGCGVMLGVSRKRMIGVVSGVESPAGAGFRVGSRGAGCFGTGGADYQVPRCGGASAGV